MPEQVIAYDAFIDAAAALRPEWALVLGSGLGNIAASLLDQVASIPFVDVPGLAAPSVPGHAGRLTLGRWAGRSMLLFEGRLHFYEGHPWETALAPISIAARLGVHSLVLTNAAGGIRSDLTPGSLMAVRDHLDWTRPWYWRAPDRPSPYSPRLLQKLEDAARQTGAKMQVGAYAAVTGPCYETPAEIRALQACGADAVGMSTVREVQAGFAGGLECAAVSLITNRAAGLSPGPITHQEVLTNAAVGTERLANVLEEFFRQPC